MSPAKRGPKPKHVPQRTCLGCRTVNAKRQLVRLVRTPEGRVLVDPTGKANGRGAYVHERRQCWDTALQTHLVDRALKIELTDANRADLLAHGAQYSNED